MMLNDKNSPLFDGIAEDFIHHFKNILSPDVIDSDLSHIQHTDCEIL